MQTNNTGRDMAIFSTYFDETVYEGTSLELKFPNKVSSNQILLVLNKETSRNMRLKCSEIESQ